MPAQLSQRTVKKITTSPPLGKNPSTQGMPHDPKISPSAPEDLIQKSKSSNRSERLRHPPSFSPSRVLIPVPTFCRLQRFPKRIQPVTFIIVQGKAETSPGNDPAELQPTATRSSASQPHILYRISPITQVPSAITNFPDNADNKDSDIIPTRWPRSSRSTSGSPP